MSRWLSFGYGLVLLSFVVYVSTVFALPQVRNPRYCCEQSSIAAAISNVTYGARLGTLFSGVFDYLVDRADKPLEDALQEAKTPGIGLPASPPGELFNTTRDGNGVGYPLAATIAFGLFGLHSWALTLFMLVLMGFSAVVFLWRFPGPSSAAVVTLYFATLTVMLFTPLVWDPVIAQQIAVAGIRYFSLVTVLPFFHLILEILEQSPRHSETAKRNATLLGFQTGILVLSVLVRGSALPLVGAIVLVALVVGCRGWRHQDTRASLLGKIKVMGLVSMGFLATVVLLVPKNYVKQGRFGTVIWQRVTESLGVNPAWPFPGANEMFDCRKYVPGGLDPGTSDNNGTCIWIDYITKHGIPIETIADKTFGSTYEVALREAFFKLAARYPREVLKTFVYYKPLLIMRAIGRSLQFNFTGDQSKAMYADRFTVSPYSPLSIALLLLSLIVVLVFFSVENIRMRDLRLVAGITVLGALFAVPAYLAAWAMVHTSADLLLYCLMSAGLACGAGVVFIRSRLLRLASTNAEA